jgi:SAM-dependent methyltransferase
VWLIGIIRIFIRKFWSSLWVAKNKVRSQRWGFSPTQIYGVSFFDGLGCAEGASKAAEVVQVLMEVFSPQKVFDIGCGSGFYLNEFAKVGVSAVGCEGSTVGVLRCAPPALVFQWDLRKKLLLNSKFDLVLCIEVAEHLPARSSKILVRSITDLASQHVVFTTSPPGSEGDDHINCKEPEFWDALFNKHGFMVNKELSGILRRRFQEIGAARWLQLHLAVYDKKQ